MFYYIIVGLFAVLLVLMLLWVYHAVQFYRKRNDMLISVSIIDKHEAKSQGYLMLSIGFIVPILLLIVFLL